MFDQRIAEYLRLVDEHPRLFQTPSGGMDILTDPEEIRRAEAEVAARYERRGMPRAWAEVGVHYRDPYLFVMRDAVVFPDGSRGIHHRAVRSDRDFSGVVVLPLYQDGLLLIRHFRHPTRQWHWEFPRGAIEPGSTPEQTVAIEMREELDAEVEDIAPLAKIYGATGFLGIGVLIFRARVARYGQPAREEGIEAVRRVSVAEFETLARTQQITDGLTLGAFFHARLHGLV